MAKFNPLDHPICFSYPLRLGSPAHMAHVPFAMFLVDLLRPRGIVEIGIREGTIFCGYSQTVKGLRLDTRCFGISEWTNGDRANVNSDILEQVKTHHDTLYQQFSQLVTSSASEAHKRFDEGAIDLLHIGDNRAVKELPTWFEPWLPKLSAQAVVVVHNINSREQGSSAWRLWNELKSGRKHFEFTHAGGLGVVAIGEHARLGSFLEMDDRDRTLTREFFHQLGRRLELPAPDDEIKNRDAIVSSLSDLLAVRSAELEARTNELEDKKDLFNRLSRDYAQKCDELEEEQLTVTAVSSELGAKATQLNAIVNSNAWRWVTRYGHFKNRFISPVLSRFGVASDVDNVTRVPSERYEEWVNKYDTLGDEDFARIRDRITRLEYKPLLSVIMPVYNVAEEWLRRAIESVQGQLYDHWELCIADDHSPEPHIRRVLTEYAEKDPRIKIVFREQNGHISAASNSALEIVTGEFVALLDHDDELTPHALYLAVEELNAHPEADLIYSDEDKIDESGDRFDPHFKTDWNPDLFYSMNFVSHLGVYRTAIMKKIGGFREGYEGSQDYDLVLRFIEQVPESHIRHIPHILYHWRAIQESVAANIRGKEYAFEAARNAIRSHFERKGQTVTVAPGVQSYHRVTYPIPSPPPLVTLIIGTRDRADLLKKVVEGILRTDYAPIEILIVDNQSSVPDSVAYLKEIQKDSRVRIVSYDSAFNFSAINNLGVRKASGEIICLINNDIEMTSPGWLTEMVSHAVRPEVGAVGAKLYYEDDRIQHAGVIIGLGGVAGHAHKYFPRRHVGYAFRMKVVQDLSAVTAACLVMRRDLFIEVGGLNETNLPIAFNDVDLCLRLREHGYRIVWTPYAELYHLESATRGSEETLERWPAFQRECAYFKSKWSKQLYCDPYYNPNLSLDSEDFSLAGPPRLTKPWML